MVWTTPFALHNCGWIWKLLFSEEEIVGKE